jgi:hypothetical protein
MASVQTFGDDAGSQAEVKIKRFFKAVHEFPQLWRKPHSKFNMFQYGQVEGADMLYLPAC